MLCRSLMGFFKAVASTTGVIATLAAAFFVYQIVTSEPNLEKHINPPVASMTLEQKASHMISYLDDDGKETALCTGTAIGPHAILTAAHCNDGAHGDINTQIKIDYSDHHYKIIAVNNDDRDHEIYLLSGPAFKNIVTPIETAPVAGDTVHFYGFGEGVYPSSIRIGRVYVKEDPSDVDADVQFFIYDLPAYHGDSGSAVYNNKNEIVGLISYSLDWYGDSKEGSYALNFDAKDLEIAEHFDPTKKELWLSPLTLSPLPSSSVSGSVSTATP